MPRFVFNGIKSHYLHVCCRHENENSVTSAIVSITGPSGHSGHTGHGNGQGGHNGGPGPSPGHANSGPIQMYSTSNITDPSANQQTQVTGAPCGPLLCYVFILIM